MLDFLIIRETDTTSVHQPWVDETPLSDHFPVHFGIPWQKPQPRSHRLVYRKLKSVNIEDIRQDISSAYSCCDLPDSVDDLVDYYNNTLMTLLDKYAPEKTKVVTYRPNSLWYTDEVCIAKQEKRLAEKRWCRTKLMDHKEI